MKKYVVGLFIGLLLAVPLVYSSFASEEEAQGHISEAERHHNEALQSESSGNFVEAAEHHHEAGLEYHKAALEYEEIGDHENAAKYHHESGKHHHMAAEQLEKAGLYAEAAKHHHEAGLHHHMAALQWEELGEHEKAAEHHHESAEHHHMAAEQLELAGRYAEAAKHHTEAAEHHIMAAKQLEIVGKFEETVKHYDEAAKHYKMAVTEPSTGSQGRLHVTQYLAWKSIPSKDYILLFDSTPDTIAGGHFAIKANCDSDGNAAIDVLMGMAPDMETVKLTHEDNMIHELSTHGEMCLYHIDLPPEHDMLVTDIAIYNPSNERVRLGMTSTATIYVNAWGTPVEHEGHGNHEDMDHME